LLAKLLSKIFAFVLEALRDKDNDHIEATSIRRFFIVKGYDEVTRFFSKWSSQVFTVMSSGDFSTMYTTIPHNDVKGIIESTLKEALQWSATKLQIHGGWEKLYIDWSSKGEVSWFPHTGRGNKQRNVHSPRHHRMSLERVLELFKFQIDNVYVKNGEYTFQQTLGVPIGVNNSQDIANLYLYGYESKYIDMLITTNEIEKAKSFHMTFRLIDDTLSADNKHWKEAVQFCAREGGIYPRALTYNDTTLSDTEVRFLGMRFIMSKKRKISIDIYDKKQDFKFFVQRYPDMRSYIPISIPYCVFTGLLHYRYHICSQPGTFIFRAVQLFNT
jgi:hypothetical protein